MKERALSIGVDIGGTHITCAAVHIQEGKLVKGSIARESYDHNAAADVILGRWAAALNHSMSAVEEAQLAGIGFAIPGPFDYRNGISKMQHKFKNLYDIHIPSALNPLLATERDLPMRFLNDATAFAVGEAWLGEGRGFQKVVVITLGTGFGSAFIENGVPVVTGETVPKEGCLWHLPYKDGIADEYFSTGWFTRTYQNHTGKNISGVKELMEKADSDDFIRSIFALFGRNLAECLAAPLRTFGAEILIIGGNISFALPLFEQEFLAGLKAEGLSLKVVVSGLKEHAALTGSARLLDDAFWEQVAAHLPHI
ncbi:MAG: ROK family protein [Saprospiraceae bacterium]|nr:ROK family protein [Saprospiraceae bacterium]